MLYWLYMKHFIAKHRILMMILSIGVVAILTLAFLLALPASRYATKSILASIQAHLTIPVSEAYSDIDTKNLSETQKKIVAITKAEYEKKPVSFDQNVLKYSQGIKEPWCADYATWVFNQAGVPLSNPNSRSWRIPGVLTLQSYFKDQDKYEAIGTYTPKTGDLAIYVGNKTLDGRSRQHTNIVLKVEGDTMTTVGGNERGRMRISTQSYKTNENSLVGFGVLDK